ncbi:putative 3-beta hydroxysteroid dehydrogenase/isomerase [Aspergillus saccharolyticus JOP 1030-1]|uniref:NAD(P)-binding protein n=1 Tax=Aspergillus saccharolyticus JOP 1030-1 TaxID=1450539 RepID=A0A318ZG21_9EURO|nr:NAD(P)-binding protein [Aspergillus saccharolyticus JOP 1030-1]PYH42570.1 NAD(P)-binding protein [Aspergillus saccharolyticus JOP 1030-1]
MSAPLIFITCATGFIGSATALEALKAGYRLRIGVRKNSDKLKELLSDYSDQTEFVIISNLTDEAVFRGKLDGVDYVLHLASPVPHGIDKEAYFPPAIKGILAILKESEKVSSIKKVVITSSAVSLFPLDGIPEGAVVKEANDWDLTVDPNANFVDPNDPVTSAMTLYQVSKLLADKAAWDFWKTNKPHYSLVTLYPVYVYGHNLMQVSAEGIQAGSNGIFWNTVMKGTPAGDLAITGVHVQDVAEAHIKALQPEIEGGSKYLLAGKPTTWNDVARIVREAYPNIGGKLTEGAQGASVPTDTSKAENELGIKWRSWEEIVRDVIDQQLAFLQSLTM